ncbi:MAG: rRNA maturation RNase YbeY [Eubacterium sp.]
MLTIEYENRSDMDVSETLYDEIQAYLERVMILENALTECEISFSFVTPEEIHRLNLEFRNVDAETDVLSFPMLEFPEDRDMLTYDTGIPVLLGDIVISTKQAIKQAEEYGNTFEREICYLAVHSAFHLFGYDHMEVDEKVLMRSREKMIMGDE